MYFSSIWSNTACNILKFSVKISTIYDFVLYIQLIASLAHCMLLGSLNMPSVPVSFVNFSLSLIYGKLLLIKFKVCVLIKYAQPDNIKHVISSHRHYYGWFGEQSKFKLIWGGAWCCARGLASHVPSILPHSRAWMRSSNRTQFLPACVSLGSDLDAYTYLAIYSSWANLVISMGLEHHIKMASDWTCTSLL